LIERVVLVRSQGIAVNIFIIILLLWLLPALVLALFLTRAVFKRGSNPRPDEELLATRTAELEDGVQAEAQHQPEKNRETKQSQQTPSCEPTTVDITEKSHAIL
jgi:hypothetical protein